MISTVVHILCTCIHIGMCYINRKIVGPHICGDAIDIEPFTLNVLTGSWRTENQVEVSAVEQHSLSFTYQVLSI